VAEITSRCQYGGSNTDLQRDLFLWDESSGITALTDEAIDFSARGSISRDGTVAAIAASADLVGTGPGGAMQLFRWVDGAGFCNSGASAPWA
jgi:hypothetical protein